MILFVQLIHIQSLFCHSHCLYWEEPISSFLLMRFVQISCKDGRQLYFSISGCHFHSSLSDIFVNCCCNEVCPHKCILIISVAMLFECVTYESKCSLVYPTIQGSLQLFEKRAASAATDYEEYNY